MSTTILFTLFTSDEAITRDVAEEGDALCTIGYYEDALACIPRIGETVVFPEHIKFHSMQMPSGTVKRVVHPLGEETIYVDCVVD